MQHEYHALEVLHSSGLPVPQPIARGDNTILMEYIGDLDRPAPSLVETSLSAGQARHSFDTLLKAVEDMLTLGIVHADLSAYNVLFWDNRPVIIDFPQVIDPRQNPDGWSLFARDVERLCQHFSKYGIRTNPASLAKSIWDRHSQTLDPISPQDLDPFID
jgi:RIO kinase 1